MWIETNRYISTLQNHSNPDVAIEKEERERREAENEEREMEERRRVAAARGKLTRESDQESVLTRTE